MESGLAAGELTVEGRRVGPGLTRAAWDGPPSGLADVDGTAFHATLSFEGERLARASLVVADPAVSGTSWMDYDPARARAWHDAFLAARLGEGRPWHPGDHPLGGVEYERPWGTIGSYLHPQDMNAVVVLTYR